jgi:tetratricopeptide (TPR) repeat protein
MSIEISPSVSQPKPIIKLWTPTTLGVLTFFLGFPAGIALATINWIKMGMARKVIPHILTGITGSVALILLPNNLGRIVGLALSWGYIAFFRSQMKSDLEKLDRFEVRNAHWFSGFLMSVALYGIVVIGVIAFLSLQSVYESMTPGHALYYSNRGDNYLNNGNYDLAIAEYTKAIELDSSLTSLYYNRGLAYESKGDYKNAISDFSQIIIMNPKDGGAFFERGLNYALNGAYESAVADFTQAIQLNPEDAYAYNNRGLSYEYLGQNEKAIQDFEKALELTTDPNLRQGVEEELRKLKGK